MSKVRLDRVREIFEAALPLDPVRRTIYLDSAAPPGSPTRREVDALLKLDQSSGDLIDSLAGDQKETHLLPGILLADRYEIQETIGSGGFGVVYAARQTHPVARKVAVKIARRALLSRSARERFDAERQALAVMQHPGIAQIFDAGTLPNGRPFIAMEYVNGTPITTAAASLPLAEKIQAIVDIADAVQHAHQKGVVHRDLKPSNILAYTESGRLRSKIIDFGIVRALGGAPDDLPRVSDGPSVMGTPRYMAPEQRSPDAAEIDTRADQYSLAVLATEILYTHTADENLLTAPAHSWPALSSMPDLPHILTKALSVDPAHRYASISEFAADLVHALHRQPVAARVWTRPYLAQRFVARHRFAVSAAAALVLLTITAFTLISRSLAQEKLARADATAQRTIAENQTKEAVAANARADADRTIALEQTYAAALSAASAAVAQDDAATAQLWLAKAPPQLRNWEWRLVAARADTSLKAISDSSSPVVAIARSNTDGTIAWLDSRGVLCIDSPQPHKRIRLDGFTDARALTFSSDGAKLFVAKPDSIVPVHVSDGFCAPSWPIADASALLTKQASLVVGRRSGPALLIDANSGTFLRLLGETSGTSAIASASSESRFVAIATGPQSISLFDLDKFVRISRFSTHAPISSLALSPSAAAIAVTLTDGSILMYDALSGAINFRLDRGSRALAFAHDGRTLLSSSDTGAIHLIDLASGTRVGSILGHTDRVTSLQVSLAEGVLTSGALDGAVRTWDLLSLCRRSPRSHGPALAISPEHQTDGVAVLRQTCIEVFDDSAQDLVRDIDLPKNLSASALTFSGQLLITVERDSPRLHAYRYNDRSWPILAALDSAPTSLLGSPCGNFLAAENADCHTRLFQVNSQTLSLGPLWQRDDTHSIAYSPDGTSLIITDYGRRSLILLNSSSGAKIVSLPLPPASTIDTARFITHDRIAVSLTDTRLIIYRATDAAILAAAQPGLGRIVVIGQTPDTSRLIAISGSSILAFDAATLRFVAGAPASANAQGGSLSADATRLTLWSNVGDTTQLHIPGNSWTPSFVSLNSQR